MPVPDRLRLVLGGLWVLDGILQLQPAMFSRSFTDDLELNVMAQPAWLARAILSAVRFLAPHIAWWNVAFVVIEIGLGLGIAARRTAKAALAISFAWAAGVWVVGEGLGGVLTGFGSIAFGAPGAAVLYVVIGLVLWPARRRTGPTAASAGLLGDGGARAAWGVLWCGAGWLQIRPEAHLSLGYRVYASFQEASLGEPGVFAHLDRVLGGAARQWGPEISYAVAAVAVVVGLGVLAGVWTRPLLWVSVGVSALSWVACQNLGALLTLAANDPQSAPLYVLLAACLYPRASTDRHPPGVPAGTVILIA